MEDFLVKGLTGNFLANCLLLLVFLPLAALFCTWNFQLTEGGPHATPVSSCLLPARLCLSIYSCVLQEVNVFAEVCSLTEPLAHSWMQVLMSLLVLESYHWMPLVLIFPLS